MQEFQLRIKNYKCFEDTIICDSLKRLNLIIGRNNSGKSSVIDIIQAMANQTYEFDPTTWRGRAKPEVILKAKIPAKILRAMFPENTSGGFTHGNHWAYGEQLIDREIQWTRSGKGPDASTFISCEETNISPALSSVKEKAQAVAFGMPIEIEGKTVRRLLSERDIKAEISNVSALEVGADGTGITNAIQNYLNSADLPSDLVENDILSGLNTIFAGDSQFTSITCQQYKSGAWEIFLQEKEKGKIALSKSGSGLKTVIAVLTFLILVPHIEKKAKESYIFALEEIENNIHPALLRRLAQFIYQFFQDSDCVLFLTTHSSVLIDMFSKQKDAQIIHITHREGKSECRTATTYFQNHGILDDLDVRASDILQSNGILWVEGPSDRLYLNRWIELWSDGTLTEGNHYQILFYGGRLLSHLSAEDPALIHNSVSILQTNRNAIILIDSDKQSETAKINPTKQRLVDEFKKIDSHVWITKGREIENYISSEVIGSWLGREVNESVEPFESFFDYLNQIQNEKGPNYKDKKCALAELLIPHMTRQNCQNRLDFNTHLASICDQIRSWNKLKPADSQST